MKELPIVLTARIAASLSPKALLRVLGLILWGAALFTPNPTLAAGDGSPLRCGPPENLETQNIIVILLGGVREQECLDAKIDSTLCHNLYLRILPEGVWWKNFQNAGRTGQQAGRAMISTGSRLGLRGGANSVDVASLIQIWRHRTGAPPEAAWFIGSNQEWSVDDPPHPAYYGRELGPREENGYSDRGAAERFVQIVDSYRPRIAFLMLTEPDRKAQYSQNPISDYRTAVAASDSIAFEVWQSIRGISNYGDKTTFVITDYHGRHQDNRGGLFWHGDSCAGCRNITFVATGPDFQRGALVTKWAEQMDLTATLAAMLGIELPHSDGRVMEALFADGRVPEPAPCAPTHQPSLIHDGPSSLVFASHGQPRRPDIHRTGDEYFVGWTESPQGDDPAGHHVMLSASTDQGRSWSPAEAVLESTWGERPWTVALTSNQDEDLMLGVSGLSWRPDSEGGPDSSWVWDLRSVRIDDGGEAIVSIASKPRRFVENRPAILAGVDDVLMVSSDSFYRREATSWLFDGRKVEWTSEYQWKDFGWSDGFVLAQGPNHVLAAESLRAGTRGILHVTKLSGTQWTAPEAVFYDLNKAAIHPAMDAAEARTVLVWIDNSQGPWSVHSAWSEDTPRDWSSPIPVDVGTSDAWRPDLWVSPDLAAVTWETHGHGRSSIRAAWSTDGAESWSAPRTIAEAGLLEVAEPRVAGDNEGFVVVWEDRRVHHRAVRAQRVEVTLR